MTSRLLFVVGLVTACSTPSTGAHVVVAITMDWEGADLTPEGMDALDAMRARIPGPLTHFVSAAYFTKREPDPLALQTIPEIVRPGDELALHLHAWRSLATASGVEPKLSPSFLTGTDEITDFDGDAGYETDLDVYSVAELRAMVRTSRTLLEKSKVRVSSSFRAGGFLATPKVRRAIVAEGFTIDSSALDYRQLDELTDGFLAKRLAALWPKVDAPQQIDGLLELPIAAFADYSTTEDIAAILDAAYARLQAEGHDVIVVLGFNLETAADLAGRITDAVAAARAKHPGAILVTTIERAAERAAK